MTTEDKRNKWATPQKVDGITQAFPSGVVGTLLPPMAEIPPEFDSFSNPWAKFIELLFFQGGQLPAVKEGIDRASAIGHLRTCLGSWEPQHEHKIAGCAWLASMWFVAPAAIQKAGA